MNRDDLFPVLTDRERALGYLKRSVSRRPQAAPQTEALFPEPEHQQRQLVPIVTPEPTELFPGLELTDRALVPVDSWPDYQAGGGVR